jgi:uncharacterized protein DUF6350
MHPLLRRGWPRAVIRGIVVALSIVALGEAVSFLLYATNVLPHETAGQAAQQGLILFYAFHRVALHVHTTALQLPVVVNGAIGLPRGSEIAATIGLALISGTVMVCWLFVRAGRAVGRAAGGGPGERALHGAKVALPYASLSCAASWFVELKQRFPHTSLMVFRPAHLSAFIWPLLLGAIFGAIGGFRSSDPAAVREWLGWRLTTKWIRRWRGVVAGATTTLSLAVAFAFVALIVVAIFDRSATSAYFRAISVKGVPSGIAVALLTALAIPNLALWVLVPAMGGCLEVGGAGTLTSAPTPYCFFSYSNSLSHPLPTASHGWSFLGFHELGAPSAWFLLFLLVPLLAAFIGGVRAARTSEAQSAREALLITSLSAVVFAVLMALALTLAWVTLTASGARLTMNNYLRYGPYPFDATQLALGWGLIAGGLGGLWGCRRLKRVDRGRRVSRIIEHER